MTLQQLKYIIAVAECGSITEAAKRLFISQPSLSGAIKEVEKEANITIFNRNRSGATLTHEGMQFVGYARQVVQQMELLEDKYIKDEQPKQRFCVSTQHYNFTANAFVDLMHKFSQDRYEFILNETQTHQIIEDVRNRFCDVGILYISKANRSVLTKLFEDDGLVFHEIFTAYPHVFISHNHPLADREILDLEDLKPYPRLSYVQGIYESANFAEEPITNDGDDKNIKITDRAAVVNLIIGLNAYTIASGIFPKYLHGDSIISIPLNVDEEMQIGYLINKDRELSELAQIYVEELRKYQYQ